MTAQAKQRRRFLSLALSFGAGLLLALPAAGCASADRTSGRSQELVVFAAASLTDTFTDLATAFEREHPSVRVRLNFAGSQSLRTQIEQGAQASVFASANKKHMGALADRGLVARPTTFAHNEMVIAVPRGNPANVRSLEDLPRAERIVLAGASVPAGVYAERVLVNASDKYGSGFRDRVMANVVSRELHVRQTLQKVVLGEADAAMVYATDAAAAGDRVDIIPIPGELNIEAAYPIAAVEGAPAPLSAAFIEFVKSDAGRQTLSSHGFRPARGDIVSAR